LLGVAAAMMRLDAADRWQGGRARVRPCRAEKSTGLGELSFQAGERRVPLTRSSLALPLVCLRSGKRMKQE